MIFPKSFKIVRLAVSIASIVILTCSLAHAQEREEAKPPERRWSVGVEGGWQQTMQGGSFRTDCNCGGDIINAGRSDAIGAVSVWYRLTDEIRVGIKGGLMQRTFSSNFTLLERFTAEFPQNDSVALDTLPLDYAVAAKVTYLSIRPVIRLYPAGHGFFVGAEPGFDLRQDSRFTLTRSLPPSTTLQFTNGKTTEQLEDRALASSPSIAYSGTITAGYEIEPIDRLFIAPVLTYTKSFTTITEDHAKNWKADAVSLELSVRYDL